MKTWKIAEFLRTKFQKILENREILSYFDILAFSKCILYFDILLVFRILILKFSRFRTQPQVMMEVETSQENVESAMTAAGLSTNDVFHVSMLLAGRCVTQLWLAAALSSCRPRQWKTVQRSRKLANIGIHCDHLVDLEKWSKIWKCVFAILDVKIGVDTAENEPSKVCWRRAALAALPAVWFSASCMASPHDVQNALFFQYY